MEHFRKFALEFSKPFIICFDLLANSNISIHHEYRNIRGMLRSSVLVFFCLTFYFSLVASIVRTFTGELGFYELANIIPVFVVVNQGIMKGIIFFSNLPNTRTLLDELGSLWRSTGLTKTQQARKGIMLRRLNLCHAVFYWLNIVGTFQYMLAPLYETLYRTFVLSQDIFLFPFLCTLPFDATRNWLVYLVTYFCEMYTMLHIVYVYLGVEFLLITLCSHLATEFQLLCEEMLHAKPVLRNIGYPDYDAHYELHNVYTKCYKKGALLNDQESDDVNDQENEFSLIENMPSIEEILERHQKLIRLAGLLDDIFNRMIFFNLLFATISICFFGFIAKVSRGPLEMLNNFVGVVASMLPIFNLCYFAEILSGASTGIADAAYHNLWYKGHVRYQKTILFIILRLSLFGTYCNNRRRIVKDGCVNRSKDWFDLLEAHTATS